VTVDFGEPDRSGYLLWRNGVVVEAHGTLERAKAAARRLVGQEPVRFSITDAFKNILAEAVLRRRARAKWINPPRPAQEERK